MKNLFSCLCIIGILTYSCTTINISPNISDSNQTKELRSGPNTVRHADLLSLIVDDYDANAAYNEYNYVLLPYFDDEFWSYGHVPKTLSHSLTAPLTTFPLSVINVIDNAGRCCIETNDPNGGYLPIPSELANTTEYEMVVANVDENGQYATDTDDGYIPIPTIIVNYENSEGNSTSVELEVDLAFYLMLIESRGLNITN